MADAIQEEDLIDVSMGSSAISRVTFNKKTGESDIQMVNGPSYHYKTIPQDVIEAFVSAPSAGAFFNKQIRKLYS